MAAMGILKHKVNSDTKHLIHCIFTCISNDIDNGIKPTVRNSTSNDIISHVNSVRAFQEILTRGTYADDSQKDMMKYRELYKEELKGFY